MKFFKRRRTIFRESGEPYMYRWNIFECKKFSIKIHKIMLSDHSCLHDHPWSFVSLILKGGYVEHRLEMMKVPGTSEKLPIGMNSKIYGPGSLLYRPAKYAHRLEIHQPCWSLVITFRKTREWGFFTKSGWVKWFIYTPTETCE